MELNEISPLVRADITKQRPIIEAAFKRFYSAIQPTVDSVTTFIHQFLEDEVDNALQSDKRIDKDACAILLPSFSIEANDIGPKYDLVIDDRWYLFAYEPNASDELQFVNLLRVPGLQLKLEDLANVGITVLISIPPVETIELVLDLIQRHKMVSRFVTIKQNI